MSMETKNDSYHMTNKSDPWACYPNHVPLVSLWQILDRHGTPTKI